VDRIAGISELATVEYYETEVFDKSKNRSWFAGLPSSVLLIAKGKVVGSIPLEPADVVINEERKVVDITLREAKVSNPQFGPQDLKWVHEQTHVFNNIDADTRNKWQGEAIKALRNARKVLSGFLGALGYSVTFKSVTK
jgi:hypothetical protein